MADDLTIMAVMSNPNISPSSASHNERFATTNWSVVLAAGGAQSSNARLALSALCELYWYPLYAFIRRRGYDSVEAQDLTQAFFTMVLEKHSFSVADPARGRFRSFLLTALKNFLAKQWREQRSQKRGGNKPLLSINFQDADDRYAQEPEHKLTAELVYDRKWALTVLKITMARLSHDYAAAGKSAIFNAIKGHLSSETPALSIREIGDSLKMTDGAVKVAIHRLRRRYRDLLRNEIADTVVDPADVDDELRSLFNLLGN